MLDIVDLPGIGPGEVPTSKERLDEADLLTDAIRLAIADGVDPDRLGAAIYDAYAETRDIPIWVALALAPGDSTGQHRDPARVAWGTWRDEHAPAAVTVVAHWAEALYIAKVNEPYAAARVRGHRATPPQALRLLVLSHLHDRWALGALTANRNTPPDALALVAAKSDEVWSLANVASHPNVPDDVLFDLAMHPTLVVRGYAARNPRLNERALRTLAVERLAWVRRSVADNPSAPCDIIEMLTKDDKVSVRTAAKKALKGSEDPAKMTA